MSITPKSFKLKPIEINVEPLSPPIKEGDLDKEMEQNRIQNKRYKKTIKLYGNKNVMRS